MFLFEDLKESHENPEKNSKVILEEVTHRIHYCVEDLLKQDCWSSQDIDDLKDCIEILCGIKKITFYSMEKNK